jgi:agmatinase
MEIKNKEYIDQNIKFLSSNNDFTICDRVILGLPMDTTTSFRPGTRLGPSRVREVSFTGGIEEYSCYQDKSLEEINFYDAGDVSIAYGDVGESLNRMEAVADDILAAGKKIFSIGGEHLVSFPLIKAYQKVYNNLAVIQFDAHTDLRDEYLGSKLSHATVMKRVIDIVGEKNVFQLGIRSGERAEFIYAKQASNLYLNQVIEVLDEVKAKVGTRPVYISLDIDVLDPAFAPGTGTPECGGITSQELLQALFSLKELNVVGFDMVEISPACDVVDVTSILGAKILREALLAY